MRIHSFDRKLHGLYGQGLKGRVQIVKPRGEKIGIHRRDLMPGIAYIHRGIKQRVGAAILLREPRLDFRLVRVEEGGEEREDRRIG